MVGRHVLCLPLLLPPLTVPCEMVFVRPDGRETCPHGALRDGLCQAGWSGDKSVPLQLPPLHCVQEIFIFRVPGAAIEKANRYVMVYSQSTAKRHIRAKQNVFLPQVQILLYYLKHIPPLMIEDIRGTEVE